MAARGTLWESLGDIAEEVEFEMHEHYPLHRARWFGISTLLWNREDAEMCIRAEFEAMSAHERLALLGRRRRQLGR